MRIDVIGRSEHFGIVNQTDPLFVLFRTTHRVY